MNIHPAGYCAGLRAPIRKSACSAAQDLTLSGEGRELVLETSTARWCKELQHTGMTDEQRRLYSISFFWQSAKSFNHTSFNQTPEIFALFTSVAGSRRSSERQSWSVFLHARPFTHSTRFSVGHRTMTFREESVRATHTREMSSSGHLLAAFALTPSWRADPICITFFTCSRCGRVFSDSNAHAECTGKIHVLIYTSKHSSFAYRQETLCIVHKIKCFPHPLLCAAGHVSICIEWITRSLRSKRTLHKLDINTDRFSPSVTSAPAALTSVTQIFLKGQCVVLEKKFKLRNMIFFFCP